VLGISGETVRTHMKSAQDRLGARNSAHAVAEAMRLRLFF
jgi:DNA-binding CsgD family transcriptional regulator